MTSYCAGCRNEIDPDVCGCGSAGCRADYDGHNFVPAGCDCLRVERPWPPPSPSPSPFTERCEVEIEIDIPQSLQFPELRVTKSAPCGRQSPEYRGWPSCRECGALVCYEHQAPDTLRSESERYSCVCVACRASEEPQR